MKKSLILVFSVLLCVLLTGCYGIVVDVNINTDGSGSFESKTGISEMAYAMVSQSSQDTEKEYEKFTYNGKTYYGDVVNGESFSSVEEFNDMLTDVNEDTEIDTGLFKLNKNNDGTLTLELNITSETSDTSEVEANMSNADISEAQKEILLKDMVVVFTFTMPSQVVQVEGDSKGITINNNKLEIDYLKLDIPQQENFTKKYLFTTQPNSSQGTTQNASRFTDVPVTLWSCKAINVLAEGGLVSGVGEGRFSPERGMKISEFCQVLANATGLESGADETGYWAAKAIKSCIDAGYIYSHGDITMKIYDEVITREEAIAAMQLASGRPQIAGSNIMLENIPDGDQISDKYKTLVLQAYNSGITTGVNEQLKFSPKNKLTRGQVCQLFYNVNWTTPINQ